MDIIYFLCFVPSLVFLLVFMYFTMVRKNEFEERLALYRPQHQLSQKMSREAFPYLLQIIKKYNKKIWTF